MTTQPKRASLATRPSGDRPHPQIVARRRLIAFAELFTDAPRKPDAVHALTRREPRVKLYDERQRSVIHAAIHDGVISRERIARYRLTQLLDDLAQFPADTTAADVTYVQLMSEQAEAVEAQTMARALPTAAHLDAAARETRESIAMQSLACAVLERGGFAPRHG